MSSVGLSISAEVVISSISSVDTKSSIVISVEYISSVVVMLFSVVLISRVSGTSSVVTSSVIFSYSS